jgi:hypothetical protein
MVKKQSKKLYNDIFINNTVSDIYKCSSYAQAKILRKSQKKKWQVTQWFQSNP